MFRSRKKKIGKDTKKLKERMRKGGFFLRGARDHGIIGVGGLCTQPFFRCRVAHFVQCSYGAQSVPGGFLWVCENKKHHFTRSKMIGGFFPKKEK